MKLNKLKILFLILLLIGFLGLIDIATRRTVYSILDIIDFLLTGFLTLGTGWEVNSTGLVGNSIFYLFEKLFGIMITANYVFTINSILGFSAGWFIIAYFVNKKMRVQENPTPENIKKYEASKNVISVSMGLLLIIPLGIILLMYIATN